MHARFRRAALAPLSCRFWIGVPCVERDRVGWSRQMPCFLGATCYMNVLLQGAACTRMVIQESAQPVQFLPPRQVPQ